MRANLNSVLMVNFCHAWRVAHCAMTLAESLGLKLVAMLADWWVAMMDDLRAAMMDDLWAAMMDDL